MMEKLTRTAWPASLQITGPKDADGINKEKSCNDRARVKSDKNTRRVNLLQSILTAFTIFVALSAIASGWRDVVRDTMVDFSYQRLLFIITIPAHLWLGLVNKNINYCITELSYDSSSFRHSPGILANSLGQ